MSLCISPRVLRLCALHSNVQPVSVRVIAGTKRDRSLALSIQLIFAPTPNMSLCISPGVLVLFVPWVDGQPRGQLALH